MLKLYMRVIIPARKQLSTDPQSNLLISFNKILYSSLMKWIQQVLYFNWSKSFFASWLIIY